MPSCGSGSTVERQRARKRDGGWRSNRRFRFRTDWWHESRRCIGPTRREHVDPALGEAKATVKEIVPAAAGGPPLVLNGINDRAPTWTPMRSSSTVASRRPKWFGPSSSVTVSWCKPRSLLLQWSSRFAY
jgi:hypothetical protein